MQEHGIVIFVDHIGRSIVGKRHDKGIFRPYIIDLVPVNMQQPNGQFQVQLVPYVFSEFVAEDKRDNVVMNFPTAVFLNDADGNDIELDARIVDQYRRLIGEIKPDTPAPAAPPGAEGEPKTVKLFD